MHVNNVLHIPYTVYKVSIRLVLQLVIFFHTAAVTRVHVICLLISIASGIM